MKKIGIIGASYLQLPVIEKAKEMGLETHVFAWAADDVGEKVADFFYPISIVEKEKILKKCQDIGIDGICTIASDLAAVTVNYVANAMGLTGNSPECARISTNKHEMRQAFERGNDPSPKSLLVSTENDLKEVELIYPIIVKPTDRSGSRGITKLSSGENLGAAIECAKEQGFEKKALVEEFATGSEYSVECISYKGEHHFLALTKKYTTGAPHFIERGHLEPAPVSEELLERVKEVVFHALDTLKIENSASHSEIKIDEDGRIVIIEIAGRMGGDCIGSHLVQLSTGVDFVKAVIDVALGEKPDLVSRGERGAAAIRYVFKKEDFTVLEEIRKTHSEYIFMEEVHEIRDDEVMDSSARYGMYLLRASQADELIPYLPKEEID